VTTTVDRSEPGRVAHTVIRSICGALNERSLPPLDERGKSIVGTQIRSLTKGGYPQELIEQLAIALALSWSEARGHSKLLHLAQRVRLADIGEVRASHDRQRAAEGEPLEQRVAALISPVLTAKRRPHPNTHAFVVGLEPNTCALEGCGAPAGCHVRLLALDDDGAATVIPTGFVR
jgi:hypothetical protein